MPNPKIILTRPHVDDVAGEFEWCADYRLSEAVDGIETGDVGFVPPDHYQAEDVVETIKGLAVEDINSRQGTYVFVLDDVISWEIR